MSTRASVCAMLAVLLIGGGSASAPQDVVDAFVGSWSLESFESFAADGEITRREMTGAIFYSASGRMSAQLMPDGYEERARDAQTRADRRGYVAYFGSYEIDPEAGTVTHHVEGSVSPGWVGRALVRHYQIDGELLRLSLRDERGRTTGTLTWRRTHSSGNPRGEERHRARPPGRGGAQ